LEAVAAVAGLGAGRSVTAPCLSVIALWQDASVGEAVATGVTCGVIVFAISGTFAWLERRGRAVAHAGSAGAER
jgi:hypothetical protein